MKNSSKPTDEKSKKLLKKKRARLRRIRKFFTFILVVTVVVLFARSSFFVVNDINVTGNKKYSSAAVVAQTGLQTGKNVFKMLGEKPKNLMLLRFKDLEKDIYESMPYIKSVVIRPSLPKAISIRVQERVPFCLLESKGTSLLIDKEGFALEEVKTAEVKNKYFTISDAEFDKYKLGEQIKFKYVDTLNYIIEFCNALIKNDKDSELKLYKKITSFNSSELNSIIVKFDNRITVKFGDMEDINYKIDYFKQLFVNNITETQKGTLDFSKSKNPYFAPEN